MQRVNLVVVCTAVFAATVVAAAQDPVKVDPGHYKALIDNPTVRVLRINYAPGTASVMHHHPDSIVVSLGAAKTEFTLPDGKKQVEVMTKDSARYTPAGLHIPKNVGTAAMNAVLVEFKAPAPGHAALPATRPGMTLKTLAEGPYATAYFTTAGPDFAEPAGTKHDFDQVVIALNPATMSLAVAGQPTRTAWKAGDAEFIGRGVAHESKNTGGKPVDMIIVAIK